MAPDTIYNGVWEYAPDFKNDAQWRAGATVTNITNKDGVLTATDRRHGHHRLADESALSIHRRRPCRRRRRLCFRDWFHKSERLEAGFTRRWRRWPSLTASSKAARPWQRVLAQMHLDGQSFAKRRQNHERHPDGAAGHAVHDRGRQQFHLLGAHGRQERRKRRQAFEDHAQLGRKVEDTPAESLRISRLSGQRRQERRHGCGVPVERRHGPRRRRHHGLSFPAFGPSRHEMAHVSQFRQVRFQDARQRQDPLHASASRPVDARHRPITGT